MNKGVFAVAVTIALSLTGCANRVVGHRGTHANVWNGTLGITGHNNEVTVQNGSHLNKLSIIGDGNSVFVEDNVTLGKVEAWGENNTISVPETLIIRDDQVGKGTKIIQRKTNPREPAQPPVEIYEPTNRVMGGNYPAQQPAGRPADGQPAGGGPAPEPQNEPAAPAPGGGK